MLFYYAYWELSALCIVTLPWPEDCEKALPRAAACTLEEYLWGTPHRQKKTHRLSDISDLCKALWKDKRSTHNRNEWCVTFFLVGVCLYWLWRVCSAFPSSCVFHFLHFSPCLLSHSHSLPLLLSLHSSPSSTSWLCSRAPSPSHQATRDSLVCSTTIPWAFTVMICLLLSLRSQTLLNISFECWVYDMTLLDHLVYDI